MKRFICAVICIIMAFSAFGVSAANVPNFMKAEYINYTADYTMSLSFENGKELALLLNEVGIGEEMSKYLDIESFFESLMSEKEKVNLQFNMSSDCKKIDLAVSGEYGQSIKPNMNLDVDYTARVGMWFHMDMDKKEFDLICSLPIHQKYMYINESEIPEEAREQLFAVLSTVLNKEFVDSCRETSLQMMLKHADVNMKGSTCVIKYDNEAFIAILSDMVSYFSEMLTSMAQAAGATDYEPEVFPLDGLKILGDKGITITYYLNGTKMSAAEMEVDICFGIAELYEKVEGEPWPYEASGNLDFTIKSKTEFTKVGTTKPMMPILTEENSFSIAEELFAGYNSYEDYEEDYSYEEYGYVSSWASCYDVEEVYENGTYFVPVRALIEDAYYNCSEITYDKGKVTAYLTDPDDESYAVTISFCVGDNKAVVTSGGESVEYVVSNAHKMVNGRVFVSTDFFEKCLGWKLDSVTKDILLDVMSYGYDTGYWEF